MACGDIVANASSKSAVLSDSSPFLASRLDCGFLLRQPRANAAPVGDYDALSEETSLFDDGSFFFEGDDEDALRGDVELRSPVEETALPRVFKSVKGISPTVVSNSLLSSARAPVHVRTSGISSENGQTSQSFAYARESPSSRPLKPDFGSRPVDIVSARPSICRGSKNCKETQKELMSVRESLLVEAWERKRDLKHHDELNIEEAGTKPERIGRCVSDSGKLPNSSTEATKTRPRSRSLTDDDFDELRGFIDLGFRFSEDCIPHLCETLPALEVYCAINQTLQDSPCHANLHGVSGVQSPVSPSPSPTSSWKVASPGDQPQDVKARLKLWAQVVACNLRQSY